jgi:hypothetical protein
VIAFGCSCPNLDDENGGGGSRIDVGGSRTNSGGGRGGRTKANTQSNTSKRSTETDNGDFQVEYVDVQNTQYESLSRSFREQKVMENAARDLNQALSLPHDITLVSKDCGKINAFYDPNDHSITVCYEIMDYYYKLFRKAGSSEQEANQSMSDTMQFIFLHELGHSLIDAYDLPVTGNEEDAADKVSSYINIKELGEEGGGSRAAIAAADAFNLSSQLRDNKELPFYDEHSLDQQRFYSILCQLYGSNPTKYKNLVTKNILPEPRAVRCPAEYEQNVRTWDRLFEKYRKQ